MGSPSGMANSFRFHREPYLVVCGNIATDVHIQGLNKNCLKELLNYFLEAIFV